MKGWFRELILIGPSKSRSACPPAQQRAAYACLNLLWPLAAGLLDVDWRELSDQEKDKLRNEIGEV